MNYDICVVGLGYIGLPTASIFATRGKKVYGLEVNPKIVEIINKGRIHIVEADLDVLVQAAVGSGNLRAGTNAVAAEIFIIAVPTPFHSGGDHPVADLTYVESAARGIAPHVSDSSLVILESTSPVGTTENVRNWINEERSKRALPQVPNADFAHCPERILPGQMLKELVCNDRLCGGLTRKAAERARNLYRLFCNGEIHLSDARTAEMVKLTENASRDVQIAFANEISLVCEHLGLNVWEVIKLANRHPRVKILNPGPGVGGHCIAVDPWFIVHAAPEVTSLMRTARAINDGRPGWVVQKVCRAVAAHKKPVIACLGLAFKADIDDLRESPAVHIVQVLARTAGFTLLVNEPNVEELPPNLRLPNVRKVSAEEAVQQADVVVLLVNHRQYTAMDTRLFKSKSIVDTRGIWS